MPAYPIILILIWIKVGSGLLLAEPDLGILFFWTLTSVSKISTQADIQSLTVKKMVKAYYTLK